jgi:hypothetical protein
MGELSCAYFVYTQEFNWRSTPILEQPVLDEATHGVFAISPDGCVGLPMIIPPATYAAHANDAMAREVIGSSPFFHLA